MVSTDLRTILLDALDDERKAKATYSAVIEKFGEIRPFINIVEAEGRHAEAIKRQLTRLGWAIPEDRWKGKVKASTSLAAACEEAIAAEIENIALYDRLIPLVSDSAARSVLQNLQAASRDKHLPAFKRCLARQGARAPRHRGGCRG
jgi:rubrerythrin